VPSNLHQLFRYARSEKVDAKENFTTEALAAAIRHDPGPMLLVLRRRGWLGEDQQAEVLAHTQVHVPGTGFIDLVLAISSDTSRDVFWIEVKVDAGEHGEQLDNYRRYIRKHGGIRLLTLGRDVLSDHVAHVTWHEVRRAALACSNSPYWADLAHFLEEIGMADDYDEALSDSEASALSHAYALLRKMTHILGPVGRHANDLWPGSAWPSTAEDLRKTLGSHFANYRRLTISNGLRTAPAWLVVGAVPEEAPAAGTVMHVGVEARPKDLTTRRILEQLLRGAVPSETWSWPTGAWAVLRARGPLPSHAALPTISAWFSQRLDELHAAGLFARLSELSRGGPLAAAGESEDD
jgi:hypothetical protein